MKHQQWLGVLIIIGSLFTLWLDRRPRRKGIPVDPVFAAKFRYGAYIMLVLGVLMVVRGILPE